MAGVGWDNFATWPIAALLALAVVACVGWAYRPQVRLLHPAMRWMLPALRVLAMGALLISVLKPILTASRSQAGRGAVLMIVDASGSMAVTDERSPSDRIAAARVLGCLPLAEEDDDVRAVRERTGQLIAALDAASIAEDEASLARTNGRSDAAHLVRAEAARDAAARTRRALTDSAGTLEGELRQAVAALAGGDIDPAAVRMRLKQVRDTLAASRAVQDGQLYRSDPATRAIADAATARARYQLATDAVAALRSSLPSDVPSFVYTASSEKDIASVAPGAALTAAAPESISTDMHAGVAAAVARFGDGPVRGVVVLGDGRQVDAKGMPASINVPVFTVNIAGTRERRDVSVEFISVPSRPFVGETVNVRARVHTVGRFDAPLRVKLQVGREQMLQAVPPGERAAIVEFQVKPQAPGILDLTLSIDPQPEEWTAVNNAVTQTVRVLSNKLKIAAYAGSPAWDFQYLRNALQRCTWAELREGMVGGSGVRLPITAEQILEQDAVVLCDVGVDALDASQWDALSQLATVGGGSVVILANDEDLLNGYANHPQAASLLPQRAGVPYAWRHWSGERPSLRVAPAPTAEWLPVSRLADDVAASARRWQELPALFRVLPLSSLKAIARPLLMETESKAPVMTELRLGAGRSILVGLNETWRWRLKVGELVQDRFLLQVIRHAAGEPYAARSGNASLDIDAATLATGGSATVRARLFEAAAKPSAAQAVRVAVTREGRTLPPMTLPVVDARPGHFEGRVENLEAGRYEFALEGLPDAPRLPLQVAPKLDREMRDVSSDPSFLQQLAESTGGKYATLESADDVAAALMATGDARYGFQQTPLWDSPYLFALVLACLSAEWGLRKRFGLA